LVGRPGDVRGDDGGTNGLAGMAEPGCAGALKRVAGGGGAG
jgi:hypothetical protein